MTETLLLTINATEVGNDGVLERTRREFTSTLRLGSKVLPEERVVDVSTAVEFECLEEGDALLGRGGGSVRLLGGVERVDVRLVVLGMVQRHDFGADVRLEGIVRVWERWELVL